MTPIALTIAGSDSGGGAGIQADLKTFAALGVHGLTAIAALTAQTSRGVHAVHLPPVEFLREQILCLLEDFDVRAVKIGMLADAARIRCVSEALALHVRSIVRLCDSRIRPLWQMSRLGRQMAALIGGGVGR